jgi:hypothetical protein
LKLEKLFPLITVYCLKMIRGKVKKVGAGEVEPIDDIF